MAKTTRERPEAYSADGIPIYFYTYKEKDRLKLHMSLRLPKERVKEGEPPYGKILYDETHKLPSEAAVDSTVIEDALRTNAPDFWRHFFYKKGCAESRALFLEKVLNKMEVLPQST